MFSTLCGHSGILGAPQGHRPHLMQCKSTSDLEHSRRTGSDWALLALPHVLLCDPLPKGHK
jgi:hypothetical protein